MKTLVLKWSFLVLLPFTISSAEQNKTHMLQDVESIKRFFDIGYAPIDWKRDNDGWDLTKEYEACKQKITHTEHLSLKDYHQTLREFVSSAKDYHVGISFYSTELATLPFRVKTIGQKTFIDYIDNKKMSKLYYSMRPGDELIEFDGTPIASVMTELLQNMKSPYSSTDRAIADIKLTKRRGAVGDVVPKGPLSIVFRSAETGELATNQLIWEYFPEYVKTPSNLMQTIPFLLPTMMAKKKLSSSYTLYNPIHQMYAADSPDEEGGLGSPTSFVPELGNPTWMWDGNLSTLEITESQDSDFKLSDYPMWNAYIYDNEEGRSIGYIRIPHYLGTEGDAFTFGQIVNYMEKHTEGLVVDQLSNFGGYVPFCYSLASMLTTTALKTPKHQIKITQEDVYSGFHTIDQIDQILSLLENDFLYDILEMLGIDEPGIDYQRLLFIKFFHQFIIEEWNQGRTLTNPIFIDGVDVINPNPTYRYSKPILFLINELDFSGGDFMPAILQDNKRVTLFGSKTAGAGGFVLNQTFPNRYGIAGVHYTGSIAERDNQQKIESLGVSPDIAYEITDKDVQNRYTDYAKAVNKVMSTLIPRIDENWKPLPKPGPSSSEPEEGAFEMVSQFQLIDLLISHQVNLVN